MNSPAFQFYAGDYLADANVQMMTLEEEGCYIRLLAYCWREGSIPSDTVMLSRLSKGASTTVIELVKLCFNQHPEDASKLVHPRLERERKKQALWREKSSEGGKKSAESRSKNKSKTKGGSKMVKPMTNQNSTLQSSSSSSNSTPISPEREVVSEWNRKRLAHWKECRNPEPWLEKIERLLKKPYWRDNWRAALDAAIKSPSLQSDRGWCPHIEWFLYDDKKKTVPSLLEGKFDFDPDSMNSSHKPLAPTINRSLDNPNG